MTSTPAPPRHTTGFLIAITVLLALLTLGLLVGGLAALRLVPEAMGLLREMKQELVATRVATQELRKEVDRMQAIAADANTQAAQRQRELQKGLASRSAKTQQELDGIAKRRAQVPQQVGPNPLAKLDTVITLNRIMADEILTLNRHLADTQAQLAKALAPLPVQERKKGR